MIFNHLYKIINHKDKTKFIALIAGNDNFYIFVVSKVKDLLVYFPETIFKGVFCVFDEDLSG